MNTSLRNTINNLKAFVSSFDQRLNSYEWMHQKFHIERKTIKEIANIVGCSPETVQMKLRKHDLLGQDKILDVYTGRFHSSKHLIMKLLKNRYLSKITQSIDEVYPQVATRNAIVLKDIFDSMIELDQDHENSSGGALGMSRKETYALGGKFGICLYDCDSLYEERINWFLQEVIRRRDEFIFDESCLPENWYPNRKYGTHTRHFFTARAKPGEQVIFVNASEVLKKEE